jgi:ribonucleoside-diphosphate reductase beta chain
MIESTIPNLDPSKSQDGARMNVNPIFNPKGDDSIDKRTMIGANVTGLFNLNAVRYPWAKNLYQVMIGNFWVPEKVSGLREDAMQYNELSEHERRSIRGILSFLIFLDSVQTTNLPNISDFITSPEVNLLLSIQAYQEAIHSQSYATILESVVDAREREEIYYIWREDPVLYERNASIGEVYQRFKDNPNPENFFETIVANYLLEGLYFYNGFAFFDTLAYQSKMLATSRMINYIRRDELTHVTLFSHIFRELRKEEPALFNENRVLEMCKAAVDQEIKWGQHILGENIPGINDQTTEDYTKWLANRRLQSIGLPPLYPDVIESPYQHLQHLQNQNGEKTNFFESTVTNYTQSSSLKGSWDF